MKKIFALSTIIAIIVALTCCKKDSISGKKPVLTFKSVSATDVSKDQRLLSFTLNIKDASGNPTSLYVSNLRGPGGPNANFDQLIMPGLESHAGVKLDAELILYVSDQPTDSIFLRLRDGDPNRPNPDTLEYQIFAVSNKADSSNMIVLPKVAVHR